MRGCTSRLSGYDVPPRIIPGNSGRGSPDRHGDARAQTPPAGRSPRQDPREALQPPHRARVRGLDPAVHPFPRQAPSARAGRGGSRAVPQPPGGRRRRGGGHAEPGAVRAAVPLPPGAGHRVAVARFGDARQAAATRAHGADRGFPTFRRDFRRSCNARPRRGRLSASPPTPPAPTASSHRCRSHRRGSRPASPVRRSPWRWGNRTTHFTRRRSDRHRCRRESRARRPPT